MPVAINDAQLLTAAIDFSEELSKRDNSNVSEQGTGVVESGETRKMLIHPLDADVKNQLEILKDKIVAESKELSYEANDTIDKLWGLLIEKAVICLRMFDEREPFLLSSCNNKYQYVYGMDKLKQYHDSYVDFEGILYGSDVYYRDHVFHAIRVWLLGIYLLLSDNAFIVGNGNTEKLIDKIHFEGEDVCSPQGLTEEMMKLVEQAEEKYPKDCFFLRHEDKIFKVHKDPNDFRIGNHLSGSERKYQLSIADTFSNEINIFEKISMWTIIALCHDLGYPLEKSKKVLEKTEKMMRTFVSNPYIEKTLRFDGTQDSNNLDIITFASKKMKLPQDIENHVESQSGTNNSELSIIFPAEYRASIQDKYKFKYKLSLEDFSHGIISAIIIYKMLIYFIETDNNPDANYVFRNEDARQFYIRRDILRAIASHTCKNIYHIDVPTFPMLLFVCDELQEWGRKSWRNMYSGVNNKAVTLLLDSFNAEKIECTEQIDMSGAITKQMVSNIEHILKDQYVLYLTTFRDGQYTDRRKFDFVKHIRIDVGKHYKSISHIMVDFSINHDKENEFKLEIHSSGEKDEIGSVSSDLVKYISSLMDEYADPKYGICQFEDLREKGGT